MNPPIVSLLLPTYGRAGELRRTLADVYSTVARPDRLEVLVYAVHQDDDTRRVLRDFEHPRTCGRGPVAMFGPHTGYAGLPTAINLLAESVSPGAGWLFVFADDVGCNTEGWDDVIRQHDDSVPTLLTCQNNASNTYWFPVLSRPAYEALGCVTESQFHDVWLGAIFDRAAPGNVHRSIPAHFTDRLVCPQSFAQLHKDQAAAYHSSVERGAARLKAAMDSLERPVS